MFHTEEKDVLRKMNLDAFNTSIFNRVYFNMDIYLKKIVLWGRVLFKIDEEGLFFQIIWTNTKFFENHKTSNIY